MNDEQVIKRLSDGLILRQVHSEADIEQCDAFNATIHGEELAGTVATMIRQHPHITPEDWFIVVDEQTGQIASSLNLLTWRWRFADVELKAGEVGFVGTLPEYRGRGLVRALMAYHHERLLAGGYDVSHIQGIPYFYKQFGYEYAMPLEGGWSIELRQIPEGVGEGFQFRRAAVADIPLLAHTYEQAASRLVVTTIRDEGDWRYLIEDGSGTELGREYWVLLDERGAFAGYWATMLRGFGPELKICEASDLPVEAAWAVLQHGKTLAQAREMPFIRLMLHESSSLVQLARSHQAADLGTYAWQVRLPDVPRIFRKLGPVFEQRLANSPYAGLTQKLVINLYREAISLRFERGKLAEVEGLPGLPDGAIRVPPLQLPVIVFGYRSLAEMEAAHHDLLITRQHRYLMETLFPKVESYLYTMY